MSQSTSRLLVAVLWMCLIAGTSLANENAVRRQVETRLHDAKVLEVRKLDVP